MRDGNPSKQPEGPKLVKEQEPEALAEAAADSEPTPLFSEPEMGDFRSQSSKLQTEFVDEPRRTVEGADKLVATVMQRLADGFANERSGLGKAVGQPKVGGSNPPPATNGQCLSGIHRLPYWVKQGSQTAFTAPKSSSLGTRPKYPFIPAWSKTPDTPSGSLLRVLE